MYKVYILDHGERILDILLIEKDVVALHDMGGYLISKRVFGYWDKRGYDTCWSLDRKTIREKYGNK